MAALPPIQSVVRYNIPLFLVLIAAGLAGNYFTFSILNAAFIFGSIFAMLALQFLGFIRGIAAAAIISGYTYFAWNHPYAVMTMTAEVAVVGWLIGRRRIHLVIADAVYWLFIGIPIGYLGFHVISDFPVSNTLFLMTKQAVNGIANALVARLIFTGYVFSSNAALISFREVLTNLLTFFVLAPALIMVTAGSRADFTDIDHQIRTRLLHDGRQMTDSLVNWLEDRKQPIVNLVKRAETLSAEQVQGYLDQARLSDSNFLRIGLIDKKGNILAYSPPVDEQGRRIIGTGIANVNQPSIPVQKQNYKPMLSEVILSRVGRPDPIVMILEPVFSGEDHRGYISGILNFKRLHAILELNSIERTVLYTLLDKNGHVIITNRTDQKVMTPFSRGRGKLSDSGNGLWQWIPELPPNTSTIELWGKSVYIWESTVGDLAEWKLILEQPVAPYQKQLYDKYTGNFFMLFMILIGSLALAELVSRRVAKTTEQLSYITHDLPAKLISGSQIDWPPKSAILDIDRLLRHFREMAESLRVKFAENRQMKESLEQRVEERTEELRKNEEFLNSIVENIPAMILMKDADRLRYVKINRAGEELLGYSREELLGKEMDDVFPQRRSDLFKKQERELLYYGQLFEIREEIIHTKHRGERVLHTKVLPVFDKQGSPQYILSISEDITEHKRAEQEMGILADIGRAVGSTLDFEKVFERVTTKVRELIPYDRLLVTLMRTNEDEFVVAYSTGIDNPGRLLGRSYPCQGTTTDVVVNTRSGILVQPEDPEEIRHIYPNIYETFKSGLRSTMSVPLISNDEVIGSLTFRSKGLKAYTERDLKLTEKIGMQIAGAIANAQLFDNLSRTERSLRESEEKYRELVEFLPISVFETDKNLRITSFNLTAVKTFRYTEAEPTLDVDGRRFFVPEERKRLEQGFREVMEGKSRSSMEYKLIRKDGSTFTGLISVSPIIKGETVTGIRGAIIDITDRIKAMEELQKAKDYLLQSEKLTAIGRLSAGVMHEILNPVNIISMELQMLMRQAELPPKADERLNVCLDQIQRIVAIAEGLRRFSRVKESRFSLNDIVAAVDQVLLFCRPQLKVKNIRTDVQRPADLPMTLMDRERIEQVILNLVENAADAMEEKEEGEKVLRITIDRRNTSEGKECLRVMIADTGTGIEKQHMTKLFEPFFTTKEPGEGIGLGLSASFGIIQDHGGKIWAENNEWGGASFFFEIPVAGDEDAALSGQRR